MEATQKLKQPLHSNEIQWSEPCAEQKGLLLSDSITIFGAISMWYNIFSVYAEICNLGQNSSCFLFLDQWQGSGGSLEAVENRKERGDIRHKHAHVSGP